jgi:hypothetical protein
LRSATLAHPTKRSHIAVAALDGLAHHGCGDLI